MTFKYSVIQQLRFINVNDTRYPSVNIFASSFTNWQKLLTLKSIQTPINYLLSLVITKLFVTSMNTSIGK